MPAIRLRRPRATLVVVAALAAAALAVTVGLSACTQFSGGGTISTIGSVDFERPLIIPPRAESTLDSQGRRVFELDATAGTSQFVDGKNTTTWGFNGAYLGPTLVAQRGEEVVVNVRNDLSEPTTVHWHGMHLPAAMDGGPHQMVQPGASWSPQWTIDQPASTLWYHPHPHGETEKHVSMGLAGMFILHDNAEAALPLPRTYGVDDIPVIVQDVRFDAAGEFVTSTRGFVGPIGNQLLVNGTVGPYLDVTTDVVRLRLLNASPARIYDFAFADGRDFALIGTDGGLLESPYATPSIQLSPGERAEILVSMTPGETVALQSLPPDLGIDAAVSGMNAGADSFEVLELRANATLSSIGTIPPALVPMERLDPARATGERTFSLDGLQINGTSMQMDRVDEVVELNSTEIWTVRNDMDMPHSLHVHDVQFELLTIDGSAPGPELSGWKDTIYLRPESEYRIIMRFEDYSDPTVPYMYHCHLLWHEDQGMMGQFVVVKPGERASLTPGTGHDH